jgi:ABC-type phosphate transport system auxiliary subunit
MKPDATAASAGKTGAPWISLSAGSQVISCVIEQGCHILLVLKNILGSNAFISLCQHANNAY